jgi:hypothetical protein
MTRGLISVWFAWPLVACRPASTLSTPGAFVCSWSCCTRRCAAKACPSTNGSPRGRSEEEILAGRRGRRCASRVAPPDRDFASASRSTFSATCRHHQMTLSRPAGQKPSCPGSDCDQGPSLPGTAVPSHAQNNTWSQGDKHVWCASQEMVNTVNSVYCLCSPH